MLVFYPALSFTQSRRYAYLKQESLLDKQYIKEHKIRETIVKEHRFQSKSKLNPRRDTTWVLRSEKYDRNGNMIQLVYNRDTDTLQYSYDSLCNLTREEHRRNGYSIIYTFRNIYVSGKLAKTIVNDSTHRWRGEPDPKDSAYVICYAYNQRGLLIEKKCIEGRTKRKEAFAMIFGTSDIIALSLNAAEKMAYRYDSIGNLTDYELLSIRDTNNQNPYSHEHYTYDLQRKPITETEYHNEDTFLINYPSFITFYTYDRKGRMLQEKIAAVKDSIHDTTRYVDTIPYYTIKYVYGKDGLKEKETFYVGGNTKSFLKLETLYAYKCW